jgi:hypothetical protein
MRGGWLGGDVHGAVLRAELLSLIDIRFGSKPDIGETSTMSPLYPNKRTSTDATGMSAKCQ